jgi:hypothetical protein
MAGTINQADVAALETYFAAGAHFERSTFGAMLSRQATVAFGANGRRHKLTKRTWWWRPGDYARGAFGSLVERYDAPAPPMHIGKGDGGEPSYTPEDRVLEAFGAASRRMLAVERMREPADKSRAESVGLRAKRVLEAYYGDRGRRWEWYATDRKDEHNKPIKGAGPGKIAAVFVLVDAGRRFLEKERERSAKRAGKTVAEMPHLTDDEVLSATYSILRVQPDQGKQALLNRIQDEAEAMVLEAQRLWRLTAPPGTEAQAARPDRRERARVYHAQPAAPAVANEAEEAA